MDIESSSSMILIDRCIPAALLSEEETARRARLIVVCGLSLAAASLLLAGSRFVLQGWHSPAGRVLVVTGVGFALVPILVRLLRSLEFPGILVPVVGTAGVFGMALTEAGLYSEALYWAPFIPLAAILMAPRLAALVVTVLSTSVFFVVLGLHLTGAQVVAEGTASAETLILRACGGASAVVFGGLLGWFYERTRQQAQARLWKMANHSPLTGLPGRALFFRELEKALLRRWVSPACVGLVLIDVDDLKAVNDSLGHDVGDELLRVVASRLSASTRQSEMPCHLCGDEFTVILELDQPEAARVAVERFRAAIEQPLQVAGKDLHPEVSLGVAIAASETTAESLFHSADAAMYVAKRAGKRGR